MGPDAAWLAKFFGLADVAPFSSADVALFERFFRSISVEAGTVLFAEGTIPTGVWVLQSGAVELIARVAGRSAVVRIVGVGESVGDIQALSRKPAPYKARTAERSSTLFAEADDLQRLLIEAPTVALRWISKLTLQVARNQDRILELLSGSLAQKVARVLCHESHDRDFCFSQSTLAAMLGVHRSSVSSLLKEFEAEGLIAVSYRRVTILNRDRLWQIASGLGVEGSGSSLIPEPPVGGFLR